MSTTKQCHILLVEDEPINRNVLQCSLNNLDCSYNTDITGKEALQFASNNLYDIIFMDTQLPDINGINITEQLRAIDNNTPITATTAHALPDEKRVFLCASMNDLLPKPFRQYQFAGLLDKWLTTEASYESKKDEVYP